jgi:hypothetical protein
MSNSWIKRMSLGVKSEKASMQNFSSIFLQIFDVHKNKGTRFGNAIFIKKKINFKIPKQKQVNLCNGEKKVQNFKIQDGYLVAFQLIIYYFIISQAQTFFMQAPHYLIFR